MIGYYSRLRGLKLEILEDLASTVRAGRGRSRRGVGGWLFADQLRSVLLTLSHNEQRELARDLFITRDNVGHVGRQVLIFLRITPIGIELLQDMEIVPAAFSIEAPGEPTAVDLDSVFLPIENWRVIEYLNRRSPGEWVDVAELREGASRSFSSLDVDFLSARGWIAIRRQERGQRGFSSTCLSRRARLVEVSTEDKWAQVFVPGVKLRPVKSCATGQQAGHLLSGG